MLPQRLRGLMLAFPASGVANSPWAPWLCSCLPQSTAVVAWPLSLRGPGSKLLIRTLVMGLGLILVQHHLTLT